MRPSIAHFHSPHWLRKMRASRILFFMEVDRAIVRLAPVISAAAGFVEGTIDDSQAVNP